LPFLPFESVAKIEISPSDSTAVATSSILTDGIGSSFSMVPVASPSRMVALTGFESVSWKSSSSSYISSLINSTEIVPLVSPGLISKVAEADWPV